MLETFLFQTNIFNNTGIGGIFYCIYNIIYPTYHIRAKTNVGLISLKRGFKPWPVQYHNTVSLIPDCQRSEMTQFTFSLVLTASPQIKRPTGKSSGTPCGHSIPESCIERKREEVTSWGDVLRHMWLTQRANVIRWDTVTREEGLKEVAAVKGWVQSDGRADALHCRRASQRC